ncbi:MAG: hypothetical protein ACLFT0_10120 [Spirulinaceae cyanobacterium]
MKSRWHFQRDRLNYEQHTLLNAIGIPEVLPRCVVSAKQREDETTASEYIQPGKFTGILYHKSFSIS